MAESATDTKFNGTPHVGNACLPCSSLLNGSCTCPGHAEPPKCDGTLQCSDYEGSLYQKLVRYAQQTCVRPSKSNEALPSNILQDVNVVMDTIRVDMARELAKECERLGGTWIDGQPNGAETLSKFYTETSANTNWGYCAPTTAQTTTPTTSTE